MRRGKETILARRKHFGPLRVQKPFYPEGGVCHVLLLHPPAGIAGGDRLEIEALLEEGSHALMTTPGAGKFYGSIGPEASVSCQFEVGKNAVLEWLPQETIVFDGAKARTTTKVNLDEEASFIGWEVICLGRRASGERFDSGFLGLSTRLERNGIPFWLERGLLEGGSPLLKSKAGLSGFSSSCTLLASGKGMSPALLAACREILPQETGALHGLTMLPDLLVGRYLGHSSEAARAWFVDIWRLLRPAMIGRDPHPPRIWRT
ncbi:MAG TPA: urease accessory protein UreD [Burkholderiales bacterium]|nr:urease accessory protein UreD [Burkholderiales bacterium]